MDSLLLEILNARHFAIQETVFGGLRSNVLNYLSTRESVHVEREHCLHAVARFAGGKLLTRPSKLTEFRVYDDDWDNEEGPQEGGAPAEESTKKVNIVRLTGVMTRGGGACSYGSLEIRDILMSAARRDDVVGHIIYCRTPGGAADTLIDYRKAIDYIHERGQKIYMFCDGSVASGGTFLSAMCDGVFAFNPEDEIGSIGMYAAFFALQNGAKNTVTQETYVEYYASKSPDKNKTFRDAADGDMKTLKEETDQYLDKLLADMKRDRPSIKEEQMTGAMYRMGDVEGSLIDGFCSLPELVERIFCEYAASHPQGNNSGNSSSTSGSNAAAQGVASSAVVVPTAVAYSAEKDNQPKINENMSKEYKNIALSAGHAEGIVMTADKDGFLTLQPQEADAVEKRIENLVALKETLTEENTKLKENNVALSESLVNANLERDDARKEVADLKKAAEAFDKEKEELQASLTAAQKEAEEQLAEKEQVIGDLQAQLAEANSGLGQKVVAGGSPANNGTAAGAAQMTSAPGWDTNLSPAENKAKMDAYLKEMSGHAHA